MKKKGLAVIVGRFQSIGLHDGYRDLLREAIQFERVLIIIGTGDRLCTNENPLPYELVEQNIKRNWGDYVNVSYTANLNNPSDEVWSNNIDLHIGTELAKRRLKDVTFIIGRDSFFPYYSGKYSSKVIEVVIDSKASSSRVRSEIGKSIEYTESFSRGVIWATQQQFPRTDLTVDIVVYNKEKDTILLGKKSNRDQWCFPGGFVEYADTDVRTTAIRELFEETGLSCAKNDLVLLDVVKIDDWRYRGSKDTVYTNLFLLTIENCTRELEAGDDLQDLNWFSVDDVKNVLVHEHTKMLPLILKELGK